MEFRKLEEKESANDLHSPRKDTSFEVSTVTAKSALNIPQLSVDSIFPLYNSSSDDASMMGVLNERKRERLLPLSESEVVPFLSDEVIAMMWSRLVLVRMEINSCTWISWISLNQSEQQKGAGLMEVRLAKSR